MNKQKIKELYLQPHWAVILTYTLLPLIFTAVPVMAQEQARRPFKVEDLFRMQKLGNSIPVFGQVAVTFSPNGERLAYVLLHPKSASETTFGLRLSGSNRGEIWMMSVPNGEPHNITNKNSAAEGYWSPVWSPDGRHLAMFSTSGDNIHVSVWDSDTGEINQLSERGTDRRQGTPVWLSDTELLFTVMAPGKRPFAIYKNRKSPEKALEGSQKMAAGDEATVSILKSGLPVDFETWPTGQLILYNVRANEQKVLYDGNVSYLSPSPDNKLIAGFEVIGKFRPEADKPLPVRSTRYQIRVFNHEGAHPAEELTSVENVFPRSLHWSPDGNKFAFAVGTYASTSETPFHIYTFSPSTGSLNRLDLGNLTFVMPPKTLVANRGSLSPPKFRWSAHNQLVIYAEKQEDKQAGWWLINASGEARNLTASLKQAPREIYRIAGTNGWVSVSAGDVWRIPTDGAEPVNLTTDLDKKVLSIAWPHQKRAITEGISEVLLQTSTGDGETGLYWLDVHSGQIERIELPSPEANLVGFSDDKNIGAFYESNRKGSYFWVRSLDSDEPRLVFEVNTFLRNIAKGDTKLITYRGLDGDSLEAWIVLPINYEKGKRYPLVTYVYPGSVSRENESEYLANLNLSHPLNLQLLASHGYAVMIPSMPMPLIQPKNGANPYLVLTDGVIPAVDKAIELGIADPNALAVMGHSFGGYASYGIITKSNRFDAAIAMAGISNLVSTYGTFDARFRYNTYSHYEVSGLVRWTENTYQGVGAQPWKKMQRYIINSPITYVERVNTPLLMIHGDRDFVPIQQAEEFYTALYRQGKPAKFVRYWGEGHVFSSPANIKHMWQQIFGWLDKYLKKENQ